MTAMQRDGRVIAATRRNLITGIRAKPLPPDTADTIIDQAAAFVQKIVNAYAIDVAQGEVGANSTGRASAQPPAAGRCPTVLLYGRVQSGKTNAMIASTALAIDNGFRIVVVLTADNVALVRQTADRFKAVGGPRVLSTATEGDEYEWTGRLDELRDDLETDGITIVCAKSAYHLPAVVGLLRDLNAATNPALVFDDEADTATPDTTLAARTSGRANAPAVASTINRRVVENTAPAELGESVLEALPHHVFVQVTATPYVLVLQRPDSPLRPGFVHLLEPGLGYRGGETFFGSFDSAAMTPDPPTVLVDDSESQALQAARLDAPAGLAASISFFLLAGTVHAVQMAGGSPAARFPAGGYKHLAHTSIRMAQHDHVADVISGHVHGLRRILRDPTGSDAVDAFAGAYAELTRTESMIRAAGAELPTLDRLLPYVAEYLSQVEIIKVNANAGEPHYGPAFNFIVGGNILGRGITIDDLLVTYYLRQAQTSQMDTVWQHGRMFGYRETLMPYTRVFLPRRLATIFKGIHEAERDLREVLSTISGGAPVPISVITAGRATRPNALEKSAIKVYRPGTQIFPQNFVSNPTAVGTTAKDIQRVLEDAGVSLTESRRESRFKDASFDTMVKLARMVPVRDDDDGRWDTDAVVSVLENLRSDFDGQGVLYARGFTRDDDSRLRTGVLSGPEVGMAAQHKKPLLALVYRGDAANPESWYPTLYLPKDVPVQVFNCDP